MLHARYMLLLLLLGTPLFAVEFTINQTVELDFRPNSIFVDDGYIYLSIDNTDEVIRYVLSGGKLRFDRAYGSSTTDSVDYLPSPIDVWIDGDYLYTMSSENIVFKFDKDTSELKFKGERASYRPKYAVAVAAMRDKIYLVDKSKNCINTLLKNGEKDYIFNGSISYTYLNTTDAIFSSPNDIAIRDDMIYIADTDNNRIAVFDANLSYMGYYGKGIGQAYITAPAHLTLDEDYLYASDWSGKVIYVLHKKNKKLVATINSSIYDFRSISGIHAYGGKLYVIDNIKKKLIILNVNKTSLLGYDDVQPLYSELREDIESLCTIFDVANQLNSSVTNRCQYYQKQLENAAKTINSSKYDDAYEFIQELRSNVDSDKVYYGRYVEGKLYSMHSDLVDRLNKFAISMPEQLHAAYSSINSSLKDAKDKIDGKNYSGALILLKEIEIRINMLTKSSEAEQNANKLLNESYSKEIESISTRYAEMKDELVKYGVVIDEQKLNNLLSSIVFSLESGNFDAAHANLSEASSLLYKAESELNVKKKDSLYASERIDAASIMLFELKNSSFFIFSPRTDMCEALLSNATASLYSNPVQARKYAEDAIIAIEREKKNFDDFKFLVIFGVLAALFLLIFFGLIGTGLRFIFRKKR